MDNNKIKVLITARNCGFFSYFLQVINTLIVIDNNKNYVVDVDTTRGEKFVYNKENKCVWNKYFEKMFVYDESKINKTVIVNQYYPYGPIYQNSGSRKNRDKNLNNIRIQFVSDVKYTNRLLMSKTIHKYLRFKEPLKSEINSYVNKYFDNKYVIGVHFRGTDNRNDTRRICPNYEVYLKYINEELNINKEKNYCIFVATDEKEFIDFIKNNFKNVFNIDAVRGTKNNDERLLDNWDCPSFLINSKKCAVKGVLLDYALLSKCNSLIYSDSNVPLAALYTNIQIKPIRLQGFGYKKDAIF